MSIQFDYHLHSFFSGDSETPAEEQVKKAISLGLSGLCFTEHHDIDYPPEPGIDFTLDFDAYIAHVNKLKTAYQDQCKICIGMEFGLQAHVLDQLPALLSRYPFDFIIVSQHVLNDKDPYYPSYYKWRDEAECYHEFLEAQIENLKMLSPKHYDTLGHLDYIVRYGPNRNLYYSYEKYADVLDPILQYLIANGKCLEINSAGLKYGLGQPHPAADVLKRYRELGGELITIGSDAHEPKHLAYDFGKVEEILTGLGFRSYTVFENRKARQILF